MTTILHEKAAQNSSTVIWKTHCKLSQTLDSSSYLQGSHNQLLGLVNFFTKSQIGLDSFDTVINEII